MDTRVWGPLLWKAMHIITFNYPEQPTYDDKQQMRQFFWYLALVLPCSACRQHFQQVLKDTNPIENHLESRNDLTRWLVNVHNQVNQRLGKAILSYEQAVQLYERYRVGNCTSGQCHSQQQIHSDPYVVSENHTDYKSAFYIVLTFLIVALLLLTYSIWKSNKK